MSRRAMHSPRPRHGVVLIIVLVIIVVLALAAYTFSQLMLTHYEVTQLSGRQVQARALVGSGVDSVRIFLFSDKTSQLEAGGLFNNPMYFQGVVVRDDPQPIDRASFTVLAPYADELGYTTGVRYGLEDESARLNLNMLLVVDKAEEGAGRTMLMALPGMTEDIADAILDWMDEDDEPRDFGAEADHYQTLDPPYAPKNGPLDTVEELLLVRGIYPQMLFGMDVNRNGIVDSHEMSMAGMDTGGMASQTPASMDRGWAGYLTLHSKESTLDPLGQPKINLNDEDLETLHATLQEVLDPNWAKFIIAYRQYGPVEESGGQDEEGEEGNQGQQEDGEQDEEEEAEVTYANLDDWVPDLTRPGQHQIKQILDLIGTEVNLDSGEQGGGGQGGGGQGGGGQGSGGQGGGGQGSGDQGDGGQGGGGGRDGGGRGGDDDDDDDDEDGENEQQSETHLASPFMEEPSAMAEYLPPLQDYTTVTAATAIPGRINLNQAPRPVLMAIPDMTDEMADALLAQRTPEPAVDDPNRSHPTWPLVESIVTLQEMKTLMPYVCGSGDVHRAQVIGYYPTGGAYARAEVIWDATEPLPRAVLWRDISHLGRGYPLEVLGVALQ